MTPKGKTIQIFLPDGNPRSVRIAEFTSRTVQAISVPRAELDFALTRPELENVGLYFLFGEPDDGGSLPQLYIGEAENFATRIKQHNKNKDWWNLSIVCISKTADFTKAHVKYLESFCHEEAKKTGRYKLENANTPTLSHVSEPVIADLMDHFESLKTLISTLGYPVFDRVPKPKSKDILYCKGKKADARGEYTEDGLTVFEGSIGNRESGPGFTEAYANWRNALIADGILEAIDEETVRFSRNITFHSPSRAAMTVLGWNVNGWEAWKYTNGKTLNEVKRKSSD
ncbi:MAG: hypothetical protein CMO55_10165 [Verrucomicrobiales bacterium]|nr:hypothetical protein [Verrucomicrobiales bacterium]